MKQLRIDDLDLQGIKAVVFDFDGTLYNNRWLIVRLAFADPRHAFWMLADRQIRQKLMGVDFVTGEGFYNAFITEISTKIGKSYEDVRDWYLRIYVPNILRVLHRHYYVAKFVKPLLNALRERGIKTVVFSDYGGVEDKMRTIGLEPNWLDYRFATADFGGLKPCKQAFKRMLQNIDIEPTEALMIGDKEESDGEGARSVGMKFLKV